MAKDKQDIGREVAATRARLARENADLAPVYGTPPPPVDPLEVPPEVVDECFDLDYEGDARILVRLFKNRYLRDSSVGGDENNKFKGVYRFSGPAWEADLNNFWLRDFGPTLNEVYRLRADVFYAKLLADLGMETMGQVRRLFKTQGKDADGAQVDLLKKADAYVARGKKCLAPARMYNAAHMAFSGPDSLAFDGEWNAHPYLLPCRNGTINISTGLLGPARPEDYFNRFVDIDYKGVDEPCPLWEEVVGQIFGYERELIDYVGYFCGAAVTGYQTKDFFIFYGPRANNGKSLFFRTLARALGPFCAEVGVDMLLQQSHRSASAAHPETLRLKGVRLVVFQEADDRDFLDAGQVKLMTSGGDKVTARALHKDIYHEFFQQYSTVLHTNKTPRIYGSDRGLSSRVKVMPCYSEFIDPNNPRGEVIDPAKRKYPARDQAEMDLLLKAEDSGILGWVVARGGLFLANSRRMPPPPPAVDTESAELMISEDLVSQFLEARCVFSGEFEERARPLYHAFKIWCEVDREMKLKEIMGERAFAREMKGHPFIRKRDKEGVVYYGLALNLPADPPAPADEARSFFGY